MTPQPFHKTSDSAKPPTDTCKHPRVQIVAREEDSEFVECLECGDIFESSEFKDMNIEERSRRDED
jgi:Zn ribbon nucleic-acid-binding protein